jgi:hypothetical protein
LKIEPTADNVRDVADVADFINAMLQRRGYEPLTEDQKDTLWSDYPDETAQMLNRLEARCGLDAEAMVLARDHIADLLPMHARQEFLGCAAA